MRGARPEEEASTQGREPMERSRSLVTPERFYERLVVGSLEGQP